ncbi:ArsR/SmtB family transcription factor [Alicyclobacillus dauci]|uniref:Helix-turn-helix domain-containing protein n=1 Tax=Alicyclobacillus dauci TaxID=1475485 RepID=A0ABY6Z587_9BACL|nr:helix-turn-helix domain-containing protein [Alicyclobacillus dauci]WAH38052.1 helix-turn-helix domain-containing protein [Alicyclobacillus dauci]
MTNSSNPNLVEVAALIGDASRANMLLSLLGGKALPASELARLAHISPQTASSHLAKMVSAGLLVLETYGRHRYYRLAGEDVAHALESLNAIAPVKPVRSLRESDQTRALRFARTCYDHVAGELGVALCDRFVELEILSPAERDFELSALGADRLEQFGIPVTTLRQERRHFSRKCLDWSERRHHLAGSLGAAMTNRFFELHWIERIPGGRAVRLTPAGRHGLRDEFGMEFAH